MIRDRIPWEKKHYDDRRVVRLRILPSSSRNTFMYGGGKFVGHAGRLVARHAHHYVALERYISWSRNLEKKHMPRATYDIEHHALPTSEHSFSQKLKAHSRIQAMLRRAPRDADLDSAPRPA